MKEEILFPAGFYKTGMYLKEMFSKPSGYILTLGFVALSEMTTTQKTLLLLAALFVFDFITGVWASYVEFKKSLPVTPGAGKRYVFSSAKMRLSAVKFITYGMGVIVSFFVESIFVIQEFEPSHISTQKLTLTTVVTLFFCSIEFYSIFFENIKRIGFDIIQKVKSIFKDGWGLYKSVKNEKDEV